MKAKAKKKASHARNARDSKNNYMAQPAGSRGSASSRRTASKSKETESGREAQW